MAEDHPRDGEPLRDGIYRAKRVCIYSAGDNAIPDDLGSEPGMVFDAIHKNAWCGYVETELADEGGIESEFNTFGGITYAENGWIGFDTLHPDVLENKPESLAEMQAEVEDLADQVIELELQRGIIDETDGEVASE